MCNIQAMINTLVIANVSTNGWVSWTPTTFIVLSSQLPVAFSLLISLLASEIKISFGITAGVSIHVRIRTKSPFWVPESIMVNKRLNGEENLTLQQEQDLYPIKTWFTKIKTKTDAAVPTSAILTSAS